MRLLTLVLAAALLPSAATAGELRVEAEGGWFELSSAKQAARAVFDSAGGATWGLSVSYDIHRGLFGRIGARYWTRSGERAFAEDADSPVFRLGHPLEVRQLPVYALVGYRLDLGFFAPYAGVGGGVTSYREESTVAEITTTTASTHGSFRAALGVEALDGPLRLGVELGWSSVPDALGAGGISERFGQTNAGGLSLVGRLMVVF